MKECIKCLVEKELGEFRIHKNNGIVNTCKVCERLAEQARHRVDIDVKRIAKRLAAEKYRQANLDKVRAAQRLDYQSKKEERKAHSKAYRSSHLEECRERERKYNAEHSLKRRLYGKLYRHRINDLHYQRSRAWVLANKDRTDTSMYWRSKNRISESTYAAVKQTNLDKNNGVLKCDLCNDVIWDGKWHLEHYTPVMRGGANDLSNLGVSHPECNRLKGRRTLQEWFKDKDVLLQLR